MSFSEWKEVKLEEICEIVMGQSPKGENCNNIGNGTPLLNGPTEFGLFHPHAIQFTTDVKKLSMKSDLLFCVRGSTTGRMNWADKEYAIGRGLAAIRHKKGTNYNHFIKGLIDYKLHEILNCATGSTFPNVGRDLLNSLPVYIPPIQEQKAIADTLSCLDDKIELNNRINKTLEEMAQAIFKSWFVDFEPFQDGEFEDSELGKIPKGWRVNALYDFAGYINGTSFKKDEYTTSGYPIVKITELKNGITSSTEYFAGIKDEKYYIKTGDILFSWSGNPQTSIDTFIWVGGDAILNQHTFKISIKNNDYSFIYLLLKFFKPEFTRIASSKQTTGLGHVTISDLKRLKFSYDNNVVNEFCIILNPLIEMYVKNLLENEKLIGMRDSLLPKLMSGEIRVPLNEV